ncbi:MAG: transposase, partial [Desulfuromonadaceae bacterium]
MFIRRTTTRNRHNGESYYTYRLVHSKRCGTKVRQVTLLNLGRHFDIAKKHWPTLCARLEQLLSAETPLFKVECSARVEKTAAQIAQQLLVQQRLPQSEDASAASDEGDAVPDIQSVDVSSLQSTCPRSVGVEHLGLWAMAQVDFAGILTELGFNSVQCSAAMGSIIGRMARPASENATWDWLCQYSALGELLDVDYSFGSKARLYRASDLLLQHRSAIESRLFARLQ